MLIRISPDGKEVLHLYDDKYNQITSKHSDMEITRATDVFFDNDMQVWKIRFLSNNEVLPVVFRNRERALKHERWILEKLLRRGVEV